MFPAAVVFELHARMKESEGTRLHEEWRRVAVDIRTRRATAMGEEERNKRAPSLIQPISLPSVIDPAWLSSLPSPLVSEAVPSAPSPSSFTSLLSTVERLVEGLSQVGSLAEDVLLSALRAIQSDLPGRVKWLMDEMEEEQEDSGEVKEWERERRREERYHLIFAPFIAQVVQLPRLLSSSVLNLHSPSSPPRQAPLHSNLRLIGCYAVLSLPLDSVRSSAVRSVHRRDAERSQANTQ